MTAQQEREEMLQFLSQEENFKMVTKNNLFELSHRTVNILPLSSFMHFNSDVMEEIMHLPSGFEKAHAFYSTVLKTETDGIKLLEAFESTGNAHLLRFLWKQIQQLKSQKPDLFGACMVFASINNNNETTPKLGILQVLAMVYLPPPAPVFKSDLTDEKINEPPQPQPGVPVLVSSLAPNFERDFSVHDKLGFGNFGVVYSVRPSTHNEKKPNVNVNATCAIKILGLRNRDDEESIQREVTLLEDLKGRNDPRSKFIVRIDKHWWEPEEGPIVGNPEEFLKKFKFHQDFRAEVRLQIKRMFFIQMELCTHDNLQLQLQKDNINGHNLRDENLRQYRRWFSQVVEGVTLLHSLGIMHRDLKPLNILLTEDEGPAELLDGNKIIAKIADFGQSRYCPTEGQTLTKDVGTPDYMSPEADGTSYSVKTDIYSLGIILVTLLKKTDFEDDEFLCGPEKHVISQELYARFEVEAKQVEKMLQKNPEERPSASDVLEWCKYNQFI